MRRRLFSIFFYVIVIPSFICSTEHLLYKISKNLVIRISIYLLKIPASTYLILNFRQTLLPTLSNWNEIQILNSLKKIT